MKDTGIIFSGLMVTEILADNKDQTRRPINPQPVALRAGEYRMGDALMGPGGEAITCPYGLAGDRLWVRESFFAFGRWETRFSADKGRDEWHFVDMTRECGHAYQFAPPQGWVQPRRGAGATPRWWRRPAIFMPRQASRITLEITGIRVERLQDISEADAIAEGVDRFPGCRQDDDAAAFNRIGPVTDDSFPIARYAVLWESINGPDSWEANPWVWVIEFKRVT